VRVKQAVRPGGKAIPPELRANQTPLQIPVRRGLEQLRPVTQAGALGDVTLSAPPWNLPGKRPA
jgi:hypothetical protein